MQRSFSKPMALVTGATGFVGSWVASELLSDGYRVRCLVRPGSDRRNLPPLSPDVEWSEGDLREPSSLRKALDGASYLFHVAADYRLWSPVPGEMIRTNVEGTRALLDACLGLPLEKIVYCSSVAALGAGKDSVPITEEMAVDTKSLIGEYKLSKYLSEQVVLSYADRLPIVVVNPSAPIGGRDIKPTPTGRIVLDYMKGLMKAYVHTGLNVIHVRDVAKGHLLAARKGRPGEKYILANRNLLLKEVFVILEKMTGIPAPAVRIPRTVLLPLAYLSEGVSRVTQREPLIPLDGIRMAHKMMFYSGEKAVQELGLVLTPVEDAFREAVEYFSTPEYLGRRFVKPFSGDGR
ncbi:MAG: hopanoid-associated sugar epimerase [Leptospirales bacterium]